MRDNIQTLEIASKDAFYAARAVEPDQLDRYIRMVGFALSTAYRNHIDMDRARRYKIPIGMATQPTLVTWVLECYNNYQWATRFLSSLCQEYEEVEGRRHKLFGWAHLYLNTANKKLPRKEWPREPLDEKLFESREFCPHWRAASWAEFVTVVIPRRRKRKPVVVAPPKISKFEQSVLDEIAKHPWHLRASIRAKMERAERLRPKVKIRLAKF